MATSAFAAPGDLVISEFRVRGPSGANDEYIEIANRTTSPITIAGGGTGYAVAASDGVARFVIPNGTVIPANGRYLGTNSVAYSLSGNATGNATWTTDIPDNAGIALFNTSIQANFTLANRLDAVGSTSEANTLYKEGTGYSALTPFSIDYCFHRIQLQAPATADIADTLIKVTDGKLRDSDNNATDFIFQDTNGTSAGAGQRLGAPGPENLASPVSQYPDVAENITRTLVDPTVSLTAVPNTIRDFTSDPANNSTFGTLSFNRVFTNNTGAPLTRLRFRIIKLTTFPAPSGVADLRPRTSTTTVVSTAGGNVTVQGTTLEQPPSQPNGGGWNSTLSVPTVSPGTPLANGASVNVRILLGLQQTGTVRFAVVLEGLPNASHIWYVNGNGDTPVNESFDPDIAAYNGAATLANELQDDGAAVNMGASSPTVALASRTFTIQNNGAVGLTGIAVTSTNPSEFTLNTAGTTATLAPGASTTFTVAFTPSAFGTRTGVINIASDDPDENPFSINLTGSGAASASNGDLLITEFRLRGPSGANDEFIEVGNVTTNPIVVQATDGSSGFSVVASDGTARFTIPNGTVIPAFGHFLGANSVAYSLSGNATANATYTTDIADNAGIALFNTSNVANFTLANRFDAVGSTSEANTLYKEGTGYSALTPFSIDYSFHRIQLQSPATAGISDPLIKATDGKPRDENNNATDFVFVDTNGTSAGAGQRLGAPGPENLSKPVSQYPTITENVARGLVDTTVGLDAAPNTVRDLTSDPANNSTFGTIGFNRVFTNNTGAPLTNLRFRLIKLTTFPAPSGFADLRPRTNAGDSVTTAGGPVTVLGTTLDQPPSQPNGGGWNSTLSVPSVTAGTPLANGASVNVRLLFGIQQTGTYRFAVLVEGLPGASHLWYVNGATGASGAPPVPTTASESFDPEITAFNGTALPANEVQDNVGTVSMGGSNPGVSGAPRTFTISNTGGGDLTDIAVASSNNAEFTVDTTGTATTLAAGASTTFTVTFTPGAAGNRSSLISIASNDPDENPFRINLQGVGVVPINAGDLVISEFRVRGPSGANDEFVEILNPGTLPITVFATDGSAGYAVAASDGTIRFTIPNGTVIPPHGHYLGTNSVAYSLSGYATGDATWTTDIPDNAGIALFKTANSANFDLARRLDAVGSTSEANTLYKEGTGYPALTPFSIDYSFYRLHLQPPATAGIDDPNIVITDGKPKDTNNNAADFVFVDTNGTSAGAGQRLGAPGPENLSKPISQYTNVAENVARGLIDTTVDQETAPNSVRDLTSDPANNSTFGTLAFNRVFTNNTGAPLTSLRFRIIKLTTFPAPSGFADLRPRTTAGGSVTTAGGPVTVLGTTLEQPPSQPNGGGWNTSLSVPSVTLGTPLANGASANVRLLFGIQQTGTYRFAVLVEGLPGASHLWYVQGETGSGSLAEFSSFEGFAPEIAAFTGTATPANEREDNVGTLDMGAHALTTSSAAQTFTLRNDGSLPLTGIAVTSTASEFTVDTTGTATTLAPGATTTFTATFTPTVQGNRTGVINIASNDANENPFRINVSGVGVVPVTAGQLVISEFRLRGPSGANDEFIEVLNPTNAAVTVFSTDGSSGFSVAASDGTARMTIPNGTVIPPHGHYLGTNSVAYSLSGYATGDVTWTTDIPDNAGLALFRTSNSANFNLGNRLDAVGSTSEANTLYKEGTGYPALTPFSIDYSFYRLHLQEPATAGIADPTIVITDGKPKDTNNNAADFVFVDTNGTSAGAGQRLGAPGPENSTKPISQYTNVAENLNRALVDPTVSVQAAPNTVRDLTSDPANNSTFGTLAFNRVFTNNTGAPLTSLRFRIIKLTTFPAPSGVSDLRPRTFAGGSVTTAGGPVAVVGTTLEQPPSQPNGGGWNTSLSVPSVTPGTPLANGASINVGVLLGIQQTGTYRFAVLLEGLPGASHLWYVAGETGGTATAIEGFVPEIAAYTGAVAPANERQDNVGSFDYGNINLGSSSAPQTFTIRNNGTVDLTGIAVTSTNATEFVVNSGSTDATLAPGATTTFTVTFSPTGSGPRSGVINIASNDADENPFRINVEGVALNTDLAVTVDALPTTAPPNSDVTFTLNLSNNGPANGVNSVVSFPLPAEMTFVSATAAAGWGSSTPAVGAGGTVTFTNALVTNGATATFTVVAKVLSTTTNGTVITATGSVSSDGTDLVPANNSDSATVNVGTVDPTVAQIGTSAAFNNQTGLFEVTVNVTNTTPFAINGFRLHADFTGYLGAQPSLRLYNATATTAPGVAYADHPYPVAVGTTVPVKLVFYTSTRVFPDPFSPTLTIETLATSQITDTNGVGVQPRLVTLGDSTRLLEFPSVAGRWYRVRYSSDMVNWQDCPVPLQAGSDRMQWIDSGPPFTEVSPALVPSRFYIVNEITAP